MATQRDKKYDYAWELYQDGLSLADIAAELGVSRQAVLFAFRMRKYPLRSKDLKPFIRIGNKKFTQRKDGHFRMTTGSRQVAQRYVWELYNGPIPDGFDVLHIDRNPANNHISNLELAPHEECCRHAAKNNKFTKGRKEVPRINKFCLECGRRLHGNPAYIAKRSFCSPRCMGLFRRKSPRGLTAPEIQQFKNRREAEKLIY